MNVGVKSDTVIIDQSYDDEDDNDNDNDDDADDDNDYYDDRTHTAICAALPTPSRVWARNCCLSPASLS